MRCQWTVRRTMRPARASLGPLRGSIGAAGGMAVSWRLRGPVHGRAVFGTVRVMFARFALGVVPTRRAQLS